MMSQSNEFLQELLTIHPELRPFYESEQYRLSVQLVDCLVASNLTKEELAKALEMDAQKFFRMTSGDNTIEVEEYHAVIQRIKNREN